MSGSINDLSPVGTTGEYKPNGDIRQPEYKEQYTLISE